MDGTAPAVRRAVVSAVLGAMLALSGCGGGGVSTPAATTVPTAPPTTLTPTTVTSTTLRAAAVPSVVGRDLGTARAMLEAAGYRFNPHDATQKNRTPADDWVVYSQSPGPGTPPSPLPASVVIYLEVLKKGERRVPPGTSPCPRFTQC